MKQRNGKGALLWPEKAPLTEVKVVQKSERVHFNLENSPLTQSESPKNIKLSDSAGHKKDILLEELLSLKPDEFPFRKRELTKKYGITSADLRKFWEKSQMLLEVKGNDLPLWAQEIEKWPEEVDLVEIFNLIERIIRKFFVISDGDVVSCVLWIVHSWFNSFATYYPILAITAPFEGCAKSPLGELVSRLSRKGCYLLAPSMSSLFRICDKYSPTLVLDELDQYIKKPAYTELTHTLNSGVSRGAKVARTSGENQDGKREVEFFSVAGPKCIIGIQLTMVLDKTTSSRCIFINLRRAAATELAKVSDYLLDKDRPETIARVLEIKRKIKRAVEDLSIAFQQRLFWYSDTNLTFGLHGREKQKWINLIALADIADIQVFSKKNNLPLNKALYDYDKSIPPKPNWRERVVKCALSKESEVKIPSEDQELLLQIINIFRELNVEELSIKDLCAQLAHRDRMFYENKLSEIVLGRKFAALGLWRDEKGEPKRPTRKTIKGRKLTICYLTDVLRLIDGVVDKTEL